MAVTICRMGAIAADACFNGTPILIKGGVCVEAAAEQERVGEYDWFAIFPPSVAELTPAQ